MQLRVAVDPLATPTRQVVYHEHAGAGCTQPIEEMAADETGTACDEDDLGHAAQRNRGAAQVFSPISSAWSDSKAPAM